VNFRPSVLVVLSDQQLGVLVTVALTHRCPENSVQIGRLGSAVASERGADGLFDAVE
jgi:hypothetical protein